MATRRPATVLILLFTVTILLSVGPGLKAGNCSTPDYDPAGNSIIPLTPSKEILGCWMGFSAINVAEHTVQECYIVINPQATDGYDYQFDAAFTPGAGPVFYTESNGARLSINSIPELTPETQIRFIFQALTEGAHRIEVFGLELIDNQVYLYDQLTKADHNLSQNPVYEFIAFSGEDSSRFMLHFTPNALPDLTGSTSRIFMSQGCLILTGDESCADLLIYSPSGVCVYNSKLQPAEEYRIPLNLSPGIYIVKFRNRQGEMIRKILVP